MKVISTLALWAFVAYVSSEDTTGQTPTSMTTVKTSKKKYICPYIPGATIDDDDTREVCCKHIVRQFDTSWYSGGKYLTTYLSILKSWKCKQFKEECKNPTFHFNTFLKLVYMRECDEQKLHSTCLPTLRDAVNENKEQQENNQNFNEWGAPKPLARIAMPIDEENITDVTQEWRDYIIQFNSSNYEWGTLVKPCMQLAMYDTEEGGYGRYHELVNPLVPFCEFVWCGVDKNTLDNRHISVWNCMPSR